MRAAQPQQGSAEGSDLDSLMAWTQSRVTLGRSMDAIKVLNKVSQLVLSIHLCPSSAVCRLTVCLTDCISWRVRVIAMCPSFVRSLSDKTLLLASAGEWDQSLDTAQRALVVDVEELLLNGSPYLP